MFEQSARAAQNQLANDSADRLGNANQRYVVGLISGRYGERGPERLRRMYYGDRVGADKATPRNAPSQNVFMQNVEQVANALDKKPAYDNFPLTANQIVCLDGPPLGNAFVRVADALVCGRGRYTIACAHLAAACAMPNAVVCAAL